MFPPFRKRWGQKETTSLEACSASRSSQRPLRPPFWLRQVGLKCLSGVALRRIARASLRYANKLASLRSFSTIPVGLCPTPPLLPASWQAIVASSWLCFAETIRRLLRSSAISEEILRSKDLLPHSSLGFPTTRTSYLELRSKFQEELLCSVVPSATLASLSRQASFGRRQRSIGHSLPGGFATVQGAPPLKDPRPTPPSVAPVIYYVPGLRPSMSEAQGACSPPNPPATPS